VANFVDGAELADAGRGRKIEPEASAGEHFRAESQPIHHLEHVPRSVVSLVQRERVSLLSKAKIKL
jgi:hypothetical protein